MNNTNINVYQTTPISFSGCTLRDNVTVRILNTYSIGVHPWSTYYIIDPYNEFNVESLSAFIIQHMTSVNARGVLYLEQAVIN